MYAPAWALVLSILLAGCQSVALREQRSTTSALTLDGLTLTGGAAATTLESVAMLDLARQCAKATPQCADAILGSPGTVREATRLVAASDVLYRFAQHASKPGPALTQCVRLTHRYLTADVVAGRQGAMSARTQLALRLHNACTGRLVDMHEDRGVLVEWRVDPERFPLTFVQRLIRADALSPVGLRTRQIEDGIGVAAVALGDATHAQGTFPAQPFALAVNVRAEPDAQDRAVRLIVTDAHQPVLVSTAFGPMTGARDLSAAYASAAVAFEDEMSKWQGLRGPPPEDAAPKIRLLAPVDHSRTPVLLIHGLASSPMTWANLVNELQGDPDIARNFQFWLVRYPTGLPLLYNRQQLAAVISQFREDAFPDQGARAPAMVAIGHSMGGVLTRLLVSDSGTALWDAAFQDPPGVLGGSASDIDATRKLFVFSRLDGIDEVVFIAAPHRGSPHAKGILSRVIRALIRDTGESLAFLARVTANNPTSVRTELRENYLLGGPGSFDTLTPTQPVSHAASQLPLASGVRAHSLIGIKDPQHRAKGDGLVSTESAEWPGSDTHYLVGSHTLHRTPEAISIIKRILLDRLACPPWP